MRKLNFDVAVFGSGAAGVAATLGASRSGAKAILVERNACFGGQAINSQVASFCGFYTRGSKPDRVCYGGGRRDPAEIKTVRLEYRTYHFKVNG